MIYRMSSSVTALIIISLSIIIGAVGILTEQLSFLINNYHLNFIPAEIRMEEDLVILIAAYGVFLEYRYYLIEKVYPNGFPFTVKELDDYAHEIGVILILLAVIMEVVNILFLAVNNWGFSSLVFNFIEITILFVLNLVASTIILTFIYKIFRINSSAKNEV